MRIETQEVEDFLQNLEHGQVLNGIIFVRESVLVERGSPHHCFFSIQLSTLIKLKDIEALIVCGEDLGEDLNTQDGHREGSARLEEVRQKLEEFCLSRDLQLMPGRLEL